MSNSYFRFRQFVIHQDKSAMKVCTDSCILGAWSSLRLGYAKRILDIGSGTGLLSLMLAQNSTANIDGIELDHESFIQSAENVNESPWSDRVHLIEADARNYFFREKYDFIISNPPFFESDLQSPVQKKNKSKHEESFTFDDLMHVVKTNLADQGRFAVLLPHHRGDSFEKLAADNGFFLLEKLIVNQTPGHKPFRNICLFGFEESPSINLEVLTIKDASGKSSMEYETLMKEYYL